MTTKYSAAYALSLYRSILRTHAKALPLEMRLLGDKYVKSEFRLHKNTSNEDHISHFFLEWENYLRHIQETARMRESSAAGLIENNIKSDYGVDLDTNYEMTSEQKIQLEKLREETSRLKK
mmetsp:Transcript_3141/g.4185  ORF Transcript_3141/g.4185 Transcript_3141/m.4185 type:complete len:121 (+) Transcript_3141:49-411(+)